MDTVAVVAAILLGIAFVVAGGSKLAAADAWPSQARGLGAPAWSIPVVPWFELVVGALLVVQVARRPAAIVALVTLVVFTGLILQRLREGVRPPCACFGAWSAKPLGAGHVARNAALVAVAALALI
ncbi:MAG: MauE/DoxX family redox-associated membrane protein [Actinomycetota bacterium]